MDCLGDEEERYRKDGEEGGGDAEGLDACDDEGQQADRRLQSVAASRP